MRIMTRAGNTGGGSRKALGNALSGIIGRGTMLIVLAAAIATPVAIASGNGYRARVRTAGLAAAGGMPIRGGIHNPPNSSYFRTTGLFSDNGGWTARIENLGTGGTAILGCHAFEGGLPCLDSYNLSGGLAFTFNASGKVGGEILLRNPNGAPFTTNAHGVATGLNANFLQGKQASEFQLASQPAASATNAEKLAGQPASAYVSAGQLLFANVVTGPKLEGARGATAVTQSGAAYTVTFGTADVSKCAFTASPRGAALTSGQFGVEPGPKSKSDVVVNTPSGFAGGFYLQVTC
jgi:hypothetical protein